MEKLIYQLVLDLSPLNLLENELFFHGSVCRARACMFVHHLFSASQKKLSFGGMRGDMLPCMLLLYQFLSECRYQVVFIF
jgi:hypothetical protein